MRHLLSRARVDYSLRQVALSLGVLIATAACCCAGGGLPIPPPSVGQVTIAAPYPVTYESALARSDCGPGIDEYGHARFTATLLVPRETPLYRVQVSHPDPGFGVDGVVVQELGDGKRYTASAPGVFTVIADASLHFEGWRMTADDGSGSTMVVGGDVACPPTAWSQTPVTRAALSASGDFNDSIDSVRVAGCPDGPVSDWWGLSANIPAERPRYWLFISIVGYKKPGTFATSTKEPYALVTLADNDKGAPERDWQGNAVVTVLPGGRTLRFENFDYTVGARHLHLSGTITCP